MTALSVFRVAHNRFTHTGLATLLERSPLATLCVLDLGNNSLGSRGAIVLASILNVSSSFAAGCF